MKKYIVPPCITTNPIERLQDGKWLRITFLEVRKGDLLRCFNHQYEIIETGTPSNIVRATTDCYEQKIDGKQIPAIGISVEDIPNL